MGRPVHRVAIVGGGPSGVSVFREFLHFLEQETSYRSRIKITLLDKVGEFGYGMPYSTKLNGHVTNMAVATMSLKFNQDDHFYHWLLNSPQLWRHEYNIPSLAPDDVVPRRLFGLYVNHMFKEAREKADSLGVDVETITAEATDIAEENKDVRLRFGQNERHFDQLFLCIGNTTPSLGQELQGTPGYIHDAWPEERIMKAVPLDEPVVILGSGLTAIDVMITLQESGHRGPMTMVSRHGLLPKVRNKAKPYELVSISPRNIQKETQNGKFPLSLRETIALLRKEFENADIHFGADDDFYRRKNQGPIETLRQDIARVKTGHANYFSVLKAIDKQIGLIWNAMSLEARAEFDRFYSTLWNIHCYPMPLLNGLRTLKALESGQLTVRGGFCGLSYDPNEAMFRLRLQHGAGEETIATRFVINATGQGMDLSTSRCRLLRSGLQSGALLPHALGGIDVDFISGRARSAGGRFSDRIYVVGRLTRGVHFYTNSVTENVQCARRAAAHAVERIAEAPTLPVPIAMAHTELGRTVAPAHQADL
jgi:uncharacterized NAD(P)/FAD-binding protein YdhS